MQLQLLFDVAVSPNLAAGDKQITCAFPLSARLADGSVICTYRQGVTKHSHDGVLLWQQSHDGGRTWSSPQVIANGLTASPTQTVVTGGLCQTPGGALLASFGSIEGLPPNTYPFGPGGERYPLRFFLTRSDDGGETWAVDQPIQLWDAEAGHMNGQPVTIPPLADVEERVWDELQRFSFGTPDLVLLRDGTVLLTYYATLQGVIHVRACGLRVVG